MRKDILHNPPSFHMEESNCFPPAPFEEHVRNKIATGSWLAVLVKGTDVCFDVKRLTFDGSYVVVDMVCWRR